MPNVNGVHIGIGALIFISLIGLVLVVAWRRSGITVSHPAGAQNEKAQQGRLSDRQLENVAAYEARKLELEAQRACADIDEAHYKLLLKDAQRELLSDVAHLQSDGPKEFISDVGTTPSTLSTPFFATVIVSIFALSGYLYLPAGMSLGVLQELPVAASLQKLSSIKEKDAWQDEVTGLDQRLVRALETSGTSRAIKPRELRLLSLRAQLQKNLGNFSTAETIYRRLAVDNDEEAFYAASAIEAKYLARNQQGSKPLFAQDMQLEIDELWRDFPENPLVLSLAGTAAFERNDYALARQRWQAALAYLPQGGRDAEGIQRALAVVEAQLAATNSSAALDAGVEPAEERKYARVIVSVAADPRRLTANDDPATPVFIFARPPGARMPVAAKRVSLADLPITLELTDADTMAGARLSDHAELQVAARLSRSGTPTGQAGDLESDSLLIPIRHEGATSSANTQSAALDSSSNKKPAKADEFSPASIPQLLLSKER